MSKKYHAALLLAILSLSCVAQAQNFSDDFSSQRGWPVTDSSRPAQGALYMYTSEQYQITPLVKSSLAMAPAPSEASDGRFSASIFLSSNSIIGNAGLACRVRGSSYYFAGVSDGGVALIMRSHNGKTDMLARNTNAPLKLVESRLELRCEGSSLSLSIDGREVATAQDSALQGGRFALAAGSPRAGASSVLFDDVRLLASNSAKESSAQANQGQHASAVAAQAARSLSGEFEIPSSAGGRRRVDLDDDYYAAESASTQKPQATRSDGVELYDASFQSCGIFRWNNGKAGESVADYRPADNWLVQCQVQGLRATVVRSRWQYLEAGRWVDMASYTSDVERNSGELAFQALTQRLAPEGSYRLVVDANRKVLAEIPFQVRKQGRFN
jgi:hypothetical protein